MKYVSWFIGAIAIVLAVIFGSILIRNTLRTSTERNNVINAANATERVKLSDYKKPGVTVRMTVEGPVVANEKYRQLEVDVTISSRDAKVLGGYNYAIVKEVQYDNNQNAFNAFMDALDTYGFTIERSTTLKDYSGQCPEGRRYIFDLIENGKVVSSLWRSSCTDVAPGTLGVLATPIAELFRAQIPDADQLLSGQNVSF